MGKGNPRLIAWEGERTLTLTITDALMSTISFSMLSGAGVVETWELGHDGTESLIEALQSDKFCKNAVFMHTTYEVPVEIHNEKYVAVVDEETRNGDLVYVSTEAPVYAVVLNEAGGVKEYLSAITSDEISTSGETISGHKLGTGTIYNSTGDITFVLEANGEAKDSINTSGSQYQGETDNIALAAGDVVRIDCYTVHVTGATQINIDAENFAGYYYIEADTLFRDEATGKDFPAEFVIPRGKIQSNFTFNMASSGDPTTFDFTIDCFPAYTSFSRSKKVLAQLNVIDPTTDLHNYQVDKHGHAGRSGDKDVNTFWEDKSLFTESEDGNSILGLTFASETDDENKTITYSAVDSDNKTVFLTGVKLDDTHYALTADGYDGWKVIEHEADVTIRVVQEVM